MPRVCDLHSQRGAEVSCSTRPSGKHSSITGPNGSTQNIQQVGAHPEDTQGSGLVRQLSRIEDAIVSMGDKRRMLYCTISTTAASAAVVCGACITYG